MPQNKEETPQKLGFEGFPFYPPEIAETPQRNGF